MRVLLVYPESHLVPGGGIATYVMHSVRAHLAAGHDVHLCTWVQSHEALYRRSLTDVDVFPLSADRVTVIRVDPAEVREICPAGSVQKTISDLLGRTVAKLDDSWQPDIIESTDYQFPLHGYLQRRRCGLASTRAPVAIFHHGLLQDIYPASALLPNEWAVRDLAAEEQVVCWADLVFAPSQAAFRRIAKLRGDTTSVHLVREPFATTEWRRPEIFPKSKFIYYGRVSFAKGADRIVAFLNTISDWEVEQFTFLGRLLDTPHRKTDMREFLLHRLHPKLHDKLIFAPHVPHDRVLDELYGRGFFVNLSRTETFSYTTLEGLSQGVIPIVSHDSAMAEMLPEGYREQGTLQGHPVDPAACTSVLSFWTHAYDKAVAELQEFAQQEFSYQAFVGSYSAAATSAVEKHGRRRRTARPRYSSSDVTVLISTKDDADLLGQALRSVLRQTERAFEILVVDDGSVRPEHVEMLNRYSEVGAIRLIRTRNMGLVAARRLLVASAMTDLIIFLDADDFLSPTYIERTIKALNTDPDGISAVLTYRKNFEGNSDGVRCFLLGTRWHWCFNDFRMTSLLKRDVCQSLKFDPSMSNGEADDWYFWLRFTTHGHRALMVPEFLFNYRIRAGSMSQDWREGHAALTVQALQRVAAEAGSSCHDLVPALQACLYAKYKRGWDIEQVTRERNLLRSELDRLQGVKQES
jgi:hypothetical protein